MPFEIPQQEPQVETRFKEFADAMLRGCAVTGQTACLFDKHGSGRMFSCAMGALAIGLGAEMDWKAIGTFIHEGPLRSRINEMEDAYHAAYRRGIRDDNDEMSMPRERIAARIAAL